ncbi:hypothetical protein EY643_02580 [Halioglobus maricola]|uniref:CBM-cenC domain-containing protein n=1 Tax=Halioglobus maricola TaxID=2601894 RepID=A0A5P9NI02_9GAMM|nr:hypothetical protein [Halioglobus maricola]QFU74628.1 hypothetical protein EY643_02580 [Halioglobus maricola]
MTSVTGNHGTTLWRAALVAAGLLLAWQVTSLHMANYFAGKAADGEPAAADSALWWDASEPRASELKARFVERNAGDELSPAALEEISALLRVAIANDPARGSAVSHLALTQQDRGVGQAAQLAALADSLAPVEPRNQRNLARFAFEADDLQGAVVHTARAMVGAPESASRFFPLLMDVAAAPQAREVLMAIARDPTPFPWWNAFFAHVAGNAEDLDALRALVQLREQSVALPLQEYERNLYINRLRKEGLVAEAYMHWVNGLSKAQLSTLGYLYDGSFEQPFANDSGFGWVARPPRNSGIRITRGDTYGASGDQALRVSFRGKRVRFSHLYQQVFLPAGDFILSGQVRPDQLEARRGLQWRLYCSAGSSGLLGESELIVGTGDWREFEFSAAVPPECSGQILKLYSAGNRDVDHELKGTVWFDDMQIRVSK